MDMVKIYAQYQKYIAIAERMHIRMSPVQEPVMAGSVDLLPEQEFLESESAAPEKDRREIWRPMDTQEVVTRMRMTQN